MADQRSRPELAPYPDWTARYLVHKNPTQRTFVLANGDLSGSWPIHVRERERSTTSGVGSERYVSLDQRPNIWYDLRAQGAGFDYVKRHAAADARIPVHRSGTGPEPVDSRTTRISRRWPTCRIC